LKKKKKRGRVRERVDKKEGKRERKRKSQGGKYKEMSEIKRKNFI
jgi:hypothetical protein